MATELPPQSKLKIREIVQVEFEITALVQETRNISESQDELKELNSKVKKAVQSLRRKLEVEYIFTIQIYSGFNLKALICLLKSSIFLRS